MTPDDIDFSFLSSYDSSTGQALSSPDDEIAEGMSSADEQQTKAGDE